MRSATPVWVKASAVTLLLAAAGWLLAQRHDRVVNEARLSAIAATIAGRDVRVRCPGVIARAIAYDTVEGSVRFDARGRPADEASLRTFACAELDALAEGRRADALACGGCAAAADVALAVNVLAHESWHLAGIADEAEAECRAIGSIATVAQRLGTTAPEGRTLAALYATTGHRRLPARYRSRTCGQAPGAEGRYTGL